ncbi:MAG: hypothetical protein O9339_02735 [Rubrivivax sp.]|nr:hypothetical protein [Rubrivivax sp.]MCA3259840.1 hypothetical protein [Rubrivivax sp.]MCZ8029634.1 hypothetical protein [Rubrivivax sp.]
MTDDSGHGANGSGPQATPSGDAPPSAGRRTVLRRALLTGAPILVTLHSGPVAAKQITGTCIKASGFISVATFRSRNPTASTICSSRALNEWISLAQGTVTPTAAEAVELAKLLTAYAPGLTLTSYFSSKTVADVLKDSSASADVMVLKRIVAMLLNLQFGYAPNGDFSSGYLVGVWNNFASNGGNYVVSGMTWNGMTTAQWLDYLMSVNA